MGVLEHVTDPAKLLAECHRVLAPGGELYVSASFAFSVHNGPENYYHFTHYGMAELLDTEQWSEVDIRGSCSPFKTIGILLQRILLQTRTTMLIRPLVALFAYTIAYLDRFIETQYDHVDMSQGTEIDSMLPSNIQVIARK
jgi:SAM-dependent methyltransferase